MRTHIAITILTGMLGSASWMHAQSCTSPVTGWLGHYSLGNKGSGTSADGWKYQVNEQTQASVNAQGGTQLGSCTLANWSGRGAAFTGSVSDSGTIPCIPSGQQTIDIDGPASAGGSIIAINTSKNTFSYYPESGATVTNKKTNCEGSTSTVRGLGWFVVPFNWTSPYNPPTFELPKHVGTLTGKMTAVPEVWTLGQITIPWTFTFTIEPVIDPNADDPCQWIGGSSVNCQDRSLGEDIALPGTGLFLHYQSSRVPGSFSANGSATADAVANGGWTFSVHHVFDPSSRRLFLGDGNQRSLWQLGTPASLNGNLLITSKDGSEVYVFSGTTGQHLQTLKPLSGALKYQFTYDTSGYLTSIADASGNTTTIQRGSNGLPTAIVSPYGQTTKLSMNSQGFLSEATDPDGYVRKFVYTAQGSLTSRTDADGNTYTYTYDSTGALTKDSDPAGGAMDLGQTSTLSGGTYSQTMTDTTALGQASTFQSTRNVAWAENGSNYAERRTNTGPDGLQATQSNTVNGTSIATSTQLPNGTSWAATQQPDPRWGIQAPVPASGNLIQGALTTKFADTRTASVATKGNPFTLSSLQDVETINGQSYTYTYDSSTHTYAKTTPVGRQFSTVLDGLERPVSARASGLSATDLVYDSHGRVSALATGTRSTLFSYDASGNLASITDPIGRINSFTHDADGNLLEHTFSDGRIAKSSYDGNGSLLSVTTPSGKEHSFSYNSVGLLATYTPPTVSGTGPLTYTYNLDQQISSVTRPDGKTTSYDYDSAGRISSITTATTTTDYNYGATTGLLTSGTVVGGEETAYTYNGPLITGMMWTGSVTGSVSHTYDDDFHVVSRGLNSGNSIAYQYDNDGMMTHAGALSITHNAANGLLTGTALGVVTDSYSYNSFGEVTGYSAILNGASVYAAQYTRNGLGRIIAKSETVGGVTTILSYTFDKAGRLTSVTQNGKVVSTYTYDTNSNRVSAATSAGAISAAYDAQDRILTYGTGAYANNANGEVISQTVGSQVTAYQYDGSGNLLGATLPNGTHITYILDANSRRVGRSVNGALAQGFLYDGSRLVAQLNSNNQVVSQFVYATRPYSPDYMIQSGTTYRIISDQIGSPRLVVNTFTRQVAERIDYDEFGNVLLDTNPGFQPFGFAGGLYDGTTKLVHFGAREYAPAIGRWLTKDPVLFGGGDTNFYAYALCDPINLIDPDGNGTLGVSVYNVIGGGISISSSDGHVSVQIEIGVGTPGIEVETNPNGEAYTGEDMGQQTGDPGKLSIFGEAGGEVSVPVPILGKVTLIEGKVSAEISESPCPSKWDPPTANIKGCIGLTCRGPEGVTQHLAGDPFEGEGEGKGEGHGESSGSESKESGEEAGLGGKAGVRYTFPL
jgi:RHS repeat-associated protein